MPYRFDHAVMAVRDLTRATEKFERLGFVVRQGGHHPGLGTRNSLIRFGLGFLELLAVEDPSLLANSGPLGRELIDLLEEREGGFIKYALASMDLDTAAAHARGAGVEAPEPIAMSRQRPDGTVLTWRIWFPGPPSWRTPLPFLIKWDRSDAEILRTEAAAPHPNGAVGVSSVAVALHSLKSGVTMYRHHLGLGVRSEGGAEGRHARRASTILDGTRLELLEPDGPGSPVAAGLASDGEGTFQIVIAVTNVGQTKEYLDRRMVETTEMPWMHAIAVAPTDACGTRLVFVQAEPRQDRDTLIDPAT